MDTVAQTYDAAYPIAGIHPDPDNPWQGDDEAVGDSIDALGWYGAVLIQTGTGRLIAGHTRIRQALERGATTVPALILDVDDDWAPRALVGDNATNRKGQFLDDPLARVLARLADTDRGLAGTSFTPLDLAATVKALDRQARAAHTRRAVRPANHDLAGTAEIIRGDARTLDGIADSSVDLIVTSPPYFALRSYRDGGEHYDGQIGSEPSPEEFLDALWECTATWWAKLKPTGSLWVNLGDKYAGSSAQGGGTESSTLSGEATQHIPGQKDAAGRPVTDVRPKSLIGVPWRYAIGCIDGKAAPDGQRWILRAEVIWSKPNGLPESVSDRVRRSHEQWFHLVKSEHYYAAIDEVREPSTPESEAANAAAPPEGWNKRGADQGGQVKSAAFPLVYGNPLGRVPGSVWTIPSEPLVVPEGFAEHFAAFPQEWPRRIILGWSPPAWCDGCGEPRRPVVEKSAEYAAWRSEQGDWNDHVADRSIAGNTTLRKQAATPDPRLLGYECGCDDPDAATSASVVLDPFGGTGTTTMVARALGRHGIHVDLSDDYNRLARWRIYDSGHWQKTLDRTTQPDA